MALYGVQLRNIIFLQGDRFLSFAQNIGKNICENLSKN